MRLCLPLLALLVAAALPAAPLVPNVIPDPGFEAENWSLTSWEHCEFKSEYAPEGRSGNAARLDAIKPGKDKRINAIAISKPFPVQANEPYLLALWYKTAPKVSAGVSFMAFTEPSAGRGTKPPQACYNSYSLPPSDHWRIWTLRIMVPDKAVEAILLPRLGMAGTVWFDDISFLPADQARIDLKSAGEIIKLPDMRRYAGSVELPDAECSLEIYSRRDGSLVKSFPDARHFSLSTDLPVGEALDALVVSPATGSFLAAVPLPAPPLLSFDLVYPRYRKTILRSDGRSHAEARLDFSASVDILKKMSYQTVLKAPDGAVKRSETLPVVPSGDAMAPPSITVRQRLPEPLQGGRYEFLVSVAASDGTQQDFRETFTALQPAPEGAHEFTVSPDNVLLMDGKPFFARGFMGGGPEVYGPVVKAGYNVSSSFGGTPESQLKWLDGLHRIGMFGITGMSSAYIEKKDMEGLRAAVRQMRNHPALLGYYLTDEPSPTKEGCSPADLQPFYDLMVQEDPYHPVMTTMWTAEYADDYEPCLDILLFDPYPVTFKRRPLTMVSDFMTRARELIGDRKPVWVVPQAFGYDVVKGKEGDPTWVTPTPEQERCMTYLGLTTGARGVVYYCYHVYTAYDKAKKDAGGWPWVLGGYLPDQQPALWGALEQIGRELGVLEEALNRPSRMWQEGPVFIREIPATGKAEGYLIAVNSSEEKPAEAAARLQSRLGRAKKLDEISGGPALDVTRGQASLKLEPMQVGIWRLPAP